MPTAQSWCASHSDSAMRVEIATLTKASPPSSAQGGSPGVPGTPAAGISGAVATSGLRTRIWGTDEGFAHHLIDPARGTPAWTGVIQATALAPTALEAETLAKIALLRGRRAGREMLAQRGGALILDDGRVLLAATPTAAAA